MKYILITLLFLGIGCSEQTDTKPKEDNTVRTDGGEYIIKHVYHKEHKYLIFEGWKKVGIVHDPDCLCGNAK